MPYDDLLAIASTVARAAGELALLRSREGVEIAGLKSSSVDVVTLADRETESLIRSMLSDARPNDGFYGEESGAESGTTGLTWLVDPIDGTVNYLYGIPYWGVSIAVVEGEPDPLSWQALAACVAGPALGEVYTATLGGGAFLDDVTVAVAPEVALSQALVATGFSYLAELRAEQGAAIAALLPQVRDFRRMGSAALDLCAVANGRVNAFFEQRLSPWDHAAGALIAREAGAHVYGRNGDAPNSDLVLAATPVLASELEKMLRKPAP